jgi:hypothetical protein
LAGPLHCTSRMPNRGGRRWPEADRSLGSGLFQSPRIRRQAQGARPESQSACAAKVKSADAGDSGRLVMILLGEMIRWPIMDIWSSYPLR